MTDFAALLAADRGQKARPIHLVDRDGFAAWIKGAPRRRPRLIEAQRFDGKSAGAFVLLRASQRVRGCRRRQEGRGAVALVPCEARREPSRRQPTSWRKAIPATRRWAGCSRSTASTLTGPKDEPERGPRVLAHQRAAKIEPAVRLAEATALVRDLVDTPAGTSARPRSSRPCGMPPTRLGAQVKVTSGAGPVQRLSADRRRWRRRVGRARTAPGRARMGQAR